MDHLLLLGDRSLRLSAPLRSVQLFQVQERLSSHFSSPAATLHHALTNFGGTGERKRIFQQLRSP